MMVYTICLFTDDALHHLLWKILQVCVSSPLDRVWQMAKIVFGFASSDAQAFLTQTKDQYDLIISDGMDQSHQIPWNMTPIS